MCIRDRWGPAHGGANEAVLKMLAEIGRPENVKSAIDKAKDKESGFRLMGFGHRVYKNYDPRAALVRKMTHEVLGALNVNAVSYTHLAGTRVCAGARRPVATQADAAPGAGRCG